MNLGVTAPEVVRVLHMGQRHAFERLLGLEVALSSIRHRVHWHWLVLDVPDPVQVDVRDLLVRVGESGVVRGSVTGQLGEV